MIESSLSREWRDKLFSEHDWQLDYKRDPAGGSLDGVWLRPIPNEAPHGAFFKPTCKCLYPAAAREKIAADLAYDLDVPAVPVLLCDSNGRFGCKQETCCVSLVTHHWTDQWRDAFNEAILATPVGEAIARAAVEPLSRIAVFDLWIGNLDRDNDGNLIYGTGPDRASDRLAALDHSTAMGGGKDAWRDGGWSVMTVAPFPPKLVHLLDKAVMLRVAKQISQFPDERVEACIQRIPDRYMDPSARHDVVNGLIGRKSFLSAFVLQSYN